MTRLLAATLLASATAAAIVTLSARDLQPATISREEIALAADRIRADRWYDEATRLEGATAMRVSRNADMDLLLLALRQPFPQLRAATLREFGRFELAQNAPLIASFLNDPEDLVQREAVAALVQTLWDKSIAEAKPSVDLVEKHLLQERNIGMMTSLWTAIAELPIDVQTAQKYETRFVNEIRQITPLRFSAVAGLLTLAQHRRGRPLMGDTVERVKDWARAGLSNGDPTVMVGSSELGRTIHYLEILQAAQADADDIAVAAATFVCRRVVPGGCGPDIRSLGVDLLNPVNPAHVPTLLGVARDRTDMRAAAAAIRKLIQSPDVTRCQLLELARTTPAEPDVIAALEKDVAERKGECGDWSPENWLIDQAQGLASATRGTDWIAPAAALASLAKRAPDKANAIANDSAALHVQWQVRMMAAGVAAEIKDAALATGLARDEHPNVRAAALEALRTMESPARWQEAIDALSSPDHHLIRTAALILKGAPEPAAALPQLFAALRRLTEQSRDTSRRARLALLDRIGEMMSEDPADTLEWSTVLTRLLRDFDPLVAKAAVPILQKYSSSPVEARPTYRAPYQPTLERVRTLPPCVVVSLDGAASLVVVLNRSIAPVAVARFLEAAASGYYKDSTIFRDDENLSVFGNPAENDEGGWPRYARDEPGTSIGRGSLTMMNHGTDTADGRLAIRWRANPELDRRETVIGRAPVSAQAIDAIQVGKRIETIEPGGEARLAPAGPADPCNPRRPW